MGFLNCGRPDLFRLETNSLKGYDLARLIIVFTLSLIQNHWEILVNLFLSIVSVKKQWQIYITFDNIHYNPNIISHDNKINILVKVFVYITSISVFQQNWWLFNIYIYFFYISVNSSLYMSEAEVEYFSFQVKTFPSKNFILPKTIQSFPLHFRKFLCKFETFFRPPFLPRWGSNFWVASSFFGRLFTSSATEEKQKRRKKD